MAFSIINPTIGDLAVLLHMHIPRNIRYRSMRCDSTGPMIQTIFPRHQSTASILQKVPSEIVGIIFTFLPAPDQICFSLSCKYTFACSHSFIKLHGKQISQLLPPIRRPILCSNAMERPRIQLLLRLENDRWKFCSQCRSLHPHSMWRALQSTRRLHQKSFCSECHPPGAQKCYLPYAGDVDICPCLSITFHEKLHLIEACKSADTAAYHAHEYPFANILHWSSLDDLYRGLSHKCTFADHPFAKVQVETSLWIDEKTNSLRVNNRYKFEIIGINCSQELLSGTKTSFLCPHKNTGKWLERFFHEAGSSFSGGDRGFDSCHRSGYWAEWTRWTNVEGPRFFELTMSRDLGNGGWPNKNWKRNCRG